MTEFTKLSKQLEAESNSLQQQQKLFEDIIAMEAPSLSALEAIERRVLTIESSIQEVTATISAKYVTKLSQCDPISGAPRFGDNMKQKIITTKDRVDEVSLTCDHLLTAIRDWIQMVHHQVHELAACDSNAVTDSIVDDANDASARELQLEEERRQLRIEEDERRLAQLHREAEYARFRKRVRSAFRSQLQTKLRALIDQLTSQYAVGGTQLRLAIDQLVLNNNGNGKENLAKSAIKTIWGILDRIQARPDDQNIRRIRLGHPVFYDRASGATSCMAVLVAVGFTLVLDSHENSTAVDIAKQEIATPIRTMQMGKGLEPWMSRFEALHESIVRAKCFPEEYSTNHASHGNVFDDEITGMLDEFTSSVIAAEVVNDLDILAVSESLGYNLVAVMTEPSVDSGRQEDLDRWTRWFDAVKASSEIVSGYL